MPQSFIIFLCCGDITIWRFNLAMLSYHRSTQPNQTWPLTQYPSCDMSWIMFFSVLQWPMQLQKIYNFFITCFQHLRSTSLAVCNLLVICNKRFGLNGVLECLFMWRRRSYFLAVVWPQSQEENRTDFLWMVRWCRFRLFNSVKTFMQISQIGPVK